MTDLTCSMKFVCTPVQVPGSKYTKATTITWIRSILIAKTAGILSFDFDRVIKLRLFFSKQFQGFEASAAHLYPNTGREPPGLIYCYRWAQTQLLSSACWVGHNLTDQKAAFSFWLVILEDKWSNKQLSLYNIRKFNWFHPQTFKHTSDKRTLILHYFGTYCITWPIKLPTSSLRSLWKDRMQYFLRTILESF